MTICLPRSPCCRPNSPGALSISAAALWQSASSGWRGARPQPEVLAACREADLFVLAAKIGRDSDRDGLPNVLMEAQSQRLACVATQLPGIGELIEDGRTGVLVEPDNPRALATALEALIRDPARRTRLGGAGEARVRREFDMASGIAVLAALFGLPEPVWTPA